MKILLIHNYYQQRGGEDAVFEAESQLLREKGNEVETITFRNDILTSFRQKLKSGWQMLYNTDSAKLLKRKIQDFAPDIIHIHNFFRIASPAVLYVASEYNIPVVQTLHNYRLICAGALLLRQNQPCELCVQKRFPTAGIQYKCFGDSAIKSAQLTLMTGLHKTLGTFKHKVSKYITLTDFARQKILNSSLNLQESQVVVKPNSVEDYGWSKPDERQHFFLFIGRLTQEKGIDVLLKAFEKAELKLEMIGEGDIKMQEKIKELTLQNKHITFHGFQKKDFIISKLKSCQALVFPSVWYEGLPMTILEAYATGTPVIASNQQNINQIVKDKQTGLLFETGNEDSLLQTLHYFEKEKGSLESLYKNARQEYLQNYTPDQNYTRLMAIYDELVNQSI
jgi:glycosyltransferase involved in cell wall biosynthesis